MKRKFCCDSSRRMYLEHYAQSGYGVPVFVGYRGQRGHGLGSILSGFFRSALPIIRRGLGIFGREALSTGSKIANDVADGKNILESAKHRVTERINDFVPGLFSQSGSGYRRGRKRKRTTDKAAPKRKRSRKSGSSGRKKKGKVTKRRKKSRIPAVFL